jgi:hypothetical protein
VQEENTIVIDGTTSRYGRVRRGRRMANLSVGSKIWGLGLV